LEWLLILPHIGIMKLGGNLWRSSSPTSLLKQVPYRRLSRLIVNICGGASTNSLGSLSQCSVTLTVKKLFLIFLFQFVLFAPCLLVAHH